MTIKLLLKTIMLLLFAWMIILLFSLINYRTHPKAKEFSFFFISSLGIMAPVYLLGLLLLIRAQSVGLDTFREAMSVLNDNLNTAV